MCMIIDLFKIENKNKKVSKESKIKSTREKKKPMAKK